MGPEGLSGMQQGLGALWIWTQIPVVHGWVLETGQGQGAVPLPYNLSSSLQDEADPKRQKTENGASA